MWETIFLDEQKEIQKECDKSSHEDEPPIVASLSIVHDPLQRDNRDGTAVLHCLASDKRLIVQQVPRDGNCLFHSVLCQLPEGLYSGNADWLKNDVADFLRQNLILPDGYDHYWSFIALPPVNQEHDPFDADAENRREEDDQIEQIQHPETRAEAGWQKYLRRLRDGAFGHCFHGPV